MNRNITALENWLSNNQIPPSGYISCHAKEIGFELPELSDKNMALHLVLLNKIREIMLRKSLRNADLFMIVYSLGYRNSIPVPFVLEKDLYPNFYIYEPPSIYVGQHAMNSDVQRESYLRPIVYDEKNNVGIQYYCQRDAFAMTKEFEYNYGVRMTVMLR